MQEKITVIIPVYNSEKYLAECLESVLGQSFQNIEVIVVNDASPDNSQKIIDAFAAKDSRIISVRHKENKGNSAARNSGLDIAAGTSIFFIDSDDTIAQNTLESMRQAMAEHNADIVGCALRRTDEQNCNTLKIDYSSFQQTLVFSGAPNIYKAYFGGNIAVTIAGKLYKNKIWDNLRMPFGILYAEDNFIFYDVTLKCDKFVQINRPYYCHRLHNQSITGKKISEQYIIDFLKFLHKLKYFFAAGNWEPAIVKGAQNIIQGTLKGQCILPDNLAMFNPLAIKVLLREAKNYDLEQEVWKAVASCLNTLVAKEQRHDAASWWFCFGQLSHKKRIWFVVKAISQNLKVDKLLRPLAAKIKQLLGKG